MTPMDKLVEAVAQELAVTEMVMADPLTLDRLKARRILRRLEEAIPGLSDLVEGRALEVPVSTQPKAAKLTWADLKVGQVYRMKRGGLRRIDRIDPAFGRAQRWSTVHWTRLDEGPYQGKTGRQTANYFAAASGGVLLEPTPAHGEKA